MKTRVSEQLGVAYPIIQGGRQWVGLAKLAAAVSTGGGLGILTGLTQPAPDALHAEIERCRAMTSKSFGINLTVLSTVRPPPYAKYARAIAESGAAARPGGSGVLMTGVKDVFIVDADITGVRPQVRGHGGRHPRRRAAGQPNFRGPGSPAGADGGRHHRLADSHALASFGPMYEPPALLSEVAAAGRNFYPVN